LGAIAMQGVRRAAASLGETACVIGLGLIGQLTAQLLVAAGCKVIGMDLDPDRVRNALANGMSHGMSSIEELKRAIPLITARKGVDVTILTASTASSEPTQLAFEITRKKGKIVVVGAVGLDLQRSPFYEREQDFLISCSYGPGRYDTGYEMDGQDYPYAYVRWTENRNMEAFLDLIAQKRINVECLIDKEIGLAEITAAYQSLEATRTSRPLAVVIAYPERALSPHIIQPLAAEKAPAVLNGTIKLGLIGAGSFAKSTHIPNLELLRDKVRIVGVCTATGATAATMGRQLGAPLTTNDYHEIINSTDVDAVLVSTRHDNHAKIAEEALLAGKHVYLEKPLALTSDELDRLRSTFQGMSTRPVMMVGFNRRFSPFAQILAEQVAQRTTPLIMNYRVNAGMLPENHWTQTSEGGGRLRGEACHMIDFFRFLVNHPLQSYDIETLPPTCGLRPDENFCARFIYSDGSMCVLHYNAIGNEGLAKEWAELHWDRKSAVLDDFKRLDLHGCHGSSITKHQDKGHETALKTFISAIANRNSFPIPWDELYETTQAAIALNRAAWGHV
jgi:predicted dehydrogenase